MEVSKARSESGARAGPGRARMGPDVDKYEKDDRFRIAKIPYTTHASLNNTKFSKCSINIKTLSKN